jgi:hypothetical protein
MDQKSKCKAWNFESTRGKYTEDMEDEDIGNTFVTRTQSAQDIREYLTNGIVSN